MISTTTSRGPAVEVVVVVVSVSASDIAFTDLS
jgi:hypothetical protein